MKKAFSAISAFAISALAAAAVMAQSKTASADMTAIIRSHPKTLENTETLKNMAKGFDTQLEPAAAEAKQAAQALEQTMREIENAALSEAARRDKMTVARAQDELLRAKDMALREERAKLHQLLRAEEERLFTMAVADITNATAKAAATGGYDYVLDSSAMRAAAPVPFVVFANPAHDITDEVIALIGGKRPAAPAPEEAAGPAEDGAQ